MGCTAVWWSAPSPDSNRVPGLSPGWGLSVCGFCAGSLAKVMHVGLMVNGSECELGWIGDLSRVYPASCPMAAGIGSTLLVTLIPLDEVGFENAATDMLWLDAVMTQVCASAMILNWLKKWCSE